METRDIRYNVNAIRKYEKGTTSVWMFADTHRIILHKFTCKIYEMLNVNWIHSQPEKVKGISPFLFTLRKLNLISCLTRIHISPSMPANIQCVKWEYKEVKIVFQFWSWKKEEKRRGKSTKELSKEFVSYRLSSKNLRFYV